MVGLNNDTIGKKIEFSSDGFILRGTLHLPGTEYPPVVIGSHGLLSSSDSPKQIELARQCNSFGIAYFRFDHRGCGESQGDFAKVTSLSARSKDLLSAVKLMRANSQTANRFGFFGSSMGGAACLAVASEARAEAVVTFAAPVRSRSVNSSIENQFNVNDPQRSPETLRLNFDISDKLKDIHNILIFHGDADTVVPFSNALEIYQKAAKPKKLVRQQAGDHMMSQQAHQQYFIRKAALWFKSSFGL